MSIKNLSSLGEFLLGPGAVNEDSDWLTSVLISVSPLGNIISLGHGDRLVICQAKYSAGVKEFLPIFKVLIDNFMFLLSTLLVGHHNIIDRIRSVNQPLDPSCAVRGWQ